MTKINNYKIFTIKEKKCVLIVGINNPNNKYFILYGKIHKSM
jgi:hypothetical protein